IYFYRNTVYDTETQALTEELIQIVGVYNALANIFVIFYAGTLIFRERESKIDELINTTPVSNTVLYFSKFLGLLFSVILMQVLAVIMGIGLQFAAGFYQINLGLYFIEIILFGILSY